LWDGDIGHGWEAFASDSLEFDGLTRELCAFGTGVGADDNQRLFARLTKELPFQILLVRLEHNGWKIPENWRVERALIRRNGQVVFDGGRHALAVARLSRSLLDWEDCSRGW
jgi:hypothetical protein